MLAEVTIDGMEEFAFRQSIEDMLRSGEADAAARRIKSLLPPLAGEERPLPARILKISARDVTVVGWNALAARIEELDRPGFPITAIGVDIADSCQSRAVPSAAGYLPPYIETTYFSDNAFPFSESTRAQLADGYAQGAAAWQGAFEGIDDTIAIDDIDDIHGALFALQLKCQGDDAGSASDDERQAWLLGSAYLAVLIHQAVRNMALRGGLPRTLAVIVGSNDSYPGFDAPVIAARAETSASDDFFLSLSLVPELPPEAEPEPSREPEEEPERIEELFLAVEDDGWDDDIAWHLPPPGIHVTGKQLRHRFVTPESIAETTPVEKTSLFDRLFRRN